MNVAIIGASANRQKFGNKALRSYENAGFKVFAVNPNEEKVEGHRTYARVTEIPEKIDQALLYVPPSVGITVLEDLATAGVKDVYVNPGAGSLDLLERGRELGLNMIQDCAIIAIGDTPSRY